VSAAPRTVIRPGSDQDAEGFIALIGACWAEYPGCVLDVDAEVPELRALASHMRAKGGALWTAECAGRVVGMVGTCPEGAGFLAPALSPARGGEGEDCWAISRLYLSRPFRGTGLADRLLDQAEAHAIARGARRLALWTDTRFERAHRFYERRGYVHSGLTRALGDLSNTIEFYYAKPARSLHLDHFG
jgi:GNAT superfamily N-acetyltransferase